MLTTEQVAEIQADNERIWSEAADTRRPGSIRLLINDRAEIAQELERIRCGIWHQQTTELALTALIERIK